MEYGLDDLLIKLTTGTLQELLGWVTLCSNRAATQANDHKRLRKAFRENGLVCRYFRTTANNHEIMNPPLHGGGQGFESPQLHSKNY